MVLILGVTSHGLHAQYKISTNERIITAETSREHHLSPPDEVAGAFLHLAYHNDREAWIETLSEKCLEKDQPKSEVWQWLTQLQNSPRFEVSEVAKSTRINQRIIVLRSPGKNKVPTKAYLIMVREMDSWKVLDVQW